MKYRFVGIPVLSLATVVMCLPLVRGQAEDEEKAKELFTQAGKLEKERKYPEAIAAAAEAGKLAPKNDAYPAYAAKLSALIGKPEDSLRFARAAVQISPKSAGHQALLMRAATQMRDYDLARDAANKVIETGTSQTERPLVSEAKALLGNLSVLQAEACFYQACMLHRETKHVEALEKVKQGLALAPKHRALSQYPPVLEPLAQRDQADRRILDAPKEAEATLESLAKHQSKETITSSAVTLDPSKKPREMSWKRANGPNPGTEMLAIYEWIDDDHYRVCFDPSGKERPKEFRTKPGSGHILHTWKRVKE